MTEKLKCKVTSILTCDVEVAGCILHKVDFTEILKNKNLKVGDEFLWHPSSGEITPLVKENHDQLSPEDSKLLQELMT